MFARDSFVALEVGTSTLKKSATGLSRFHPRPNH